MIMGSFMRSATIAFCVAYLTSATFHNCFGKSNTICNETEKQALLKFKLDLKDPSNQLSSWVGEDCCQWAGVVCNNLTGHVHKIRLRNLHPFRVDQTEVEYEAYLSYKLGGTINPSLLDLKYLRHLDLSCNDFEGIPIPSFIGSIGRLRYLNLSQAGFSGTIPHQLGNLTMMRYLCLGGKIPSSTQLQSLDESSFIGNKLCGPPLTNCSTNTAIAKVGHGGEEDEGLSEVWFFLSLALGFVVGFWVVVGLLLFKMSWRDAYFMFLDRIGHKLSNFIFKCCYLLCK
ncbi:unnamed protein product [Camellia sinensis]